MPMSRRAQRRERGRHHGRLQEFASFGRERDRVPERATSRGSWRSDPAREREKLDEAAEREAAAQAELADAENE